MEHTFETYRPYREYTDSQSWRHISIHHNYIDLDTPRQRTDRHTSHCSDAQRIQGDNALLINMEYVKKKPSNEMNYKIIIAWFTFPGLEYALFINTFITHISIFIHILYKPDIESIHEKKSNLSKKLYKW